jgi:hypothetical protein
LLSQGKLHVDLHRTPRIKKALHSLILAPSLLAYAFTCYCNDIGCVDVSWALELYAIAAIQQSCEGVDVHESGCLDVSQFVA